MSSLIRRIQIRLLKKAGRAPGIYKINPKTDMPVLQDGPQWPGAPRTRPEGYDQDGRKRKKRAV